MEQLRLLRQLRQPKGLAMLTVSALELGRGRLRRTAWQQACRE